MKKLFFTLLTLCLCGATYAADGTPDITIEGENGGNTYYFDIVSADDHTVELTYTGDHTYPSANSYSGEITDIPEKITYSEQEYTVIGIGKYAFANCTKVTKMVIPSFIEYLGTHAIIGMDDCTTVIFESNSTALVIKDDSDSGEPVLDYTQVADLTLNRNISFDTTHALTISGLCVKNTYLKKVSIGGAATEVCDYSFYRCTSLADVTLSDSISAIGSYAFDGCSALEEVTIPASVQSFGGYCFASCSSLSRIFLLATDPANVTLATTDFQSDTYLTIYVPRGSAVAYNSSAWTQVANYNNNSFNFFSINVDATTIDTTEDPGNTCYWATYYIDEEKYEVDVPDNCTLYTITDVSNGTISMEALSGDVIPQNTPLLVKTSASGANYFWKDYYDEEGNGYFAGETAPSPITIPEGSILYGHSTSGDTFAIEDGSEVTEGYYFYKLSLDSEGNEGSIGFYWGAEGGGKYTAGANRCWLAVPDTEATNLSYLSIKKDNGDTTGISSVESAVESASVKGIYTIQGVRVSNMNQPGLYIVDGKKVLVK